MGDYKAALLQKTLWVTLQQKPYVSQKVKDARLY